MATHPKVSRRRVHPDEIDEIRVIAAKTEREVDELRAKEIHNIFTRLESLERKLSRHLERCEF